jgi:5,10-methylenetetrahydrofolate reductase
LRLQLDRHQEDAHAIADIGAEWTIRQITGLRAHGFEAHHLYVLNRAQAAQRIIKELFS